MVIFHTSDLHLGKVVNGYPMLDDQRHILEQMLEAIRREQPAAFIIAGDVYDRQVPGLEAVALLDDFLTDLAGTGTAVFIISGNHDSAERLRFASRIMQANNIYIAGGFDGGISSHTLQDAHGSVSFHLLPFFRPSTVRRYMEADSYSEAFANILAAHVTDPAARNVLIAHQFMVYGDIQPSPSGSETASVGGVDAVDISPAANYDYIALGHLHGAQRIKHSHIRYAGSPLKYSFSECRQRKGMVRIELGRKGDISIADIPLHPLRDMRMIKGSLAALTGADAVEAANHEDYIHATLTDDYAMDAMDRLRSVYPNIMSLDFDNRRTRTASELDALPLQQQQSLPELFAQFYELQNGAPLNTAQQDIIASVLEQTGVEI